MGLALTYMKDKTQLQQTPVDDHAALPITIPDIIALDDKSIDKSKFY